MANTTIPNLPMAISLSGAEQVEIVQSGVSKRTTVGAIGTLYNAFPASGIAVSTGTGWGASFTPSNPVSVSYGGTGLASLTSNYLYKGAGTSALVQSLVYDNGTNVGIGTSSPASTAILDVQSTTKGVRFPNMTTTQKNALTPSAGTVVFDTTLAKLCVYTGAAWQTITSA